MFLVFSKNVSVENILLLFTEIFSVYTQRQRAEDNKSRDNNNNTLDTVSAKNKSTETCLQGSQRNETSRCFAGINPQLLEFTSVETARCILMMGLFWRPM